MGDGSSDFRLTQAAASNLNIADQMYNTTFGARKAFTDYTMGSYKMGGFDQSQKFRALEGMTLDKAAAAGPGDYRFGLGDSLGIKAEAVSNVGSAKVAAGLEELQKIRSQLAGGGLSTTNFAQSEGNLSVKAAAQMDPNAALSTVLAAGGLASSVYGGMNKAGVFDKTTPPPSEKSGFGLNLNPSSMSGWQTGQITSLVDPQTFSLTGGPMR